MNVWPEIKLLYSIRTHSYIRTRASRPGLQGQAKCATDQTEPAGCPKDGATLLVVFLGTIGLSDSPTLTLSTGDLAKDLFLGQSQKKTSICIP